MQTVERLEDLPPLSYPVMAIGVFDGVHRGHQAILRRAVERAREKGGTALVLTFQPHPQKIIAPHDAPPLLQTWEQKAEILQGLGLDFLIRVPFSRRLSLYSPQEFAREVLFNHGVREIFVGVNFRFGHRRSGDYRTLEDLGRKLGFQVFAVPTFSFRGIPVSSTRIRNFLRQGQVALAKRLLGRPYQIRGAVVRGAGRGGPLGFPTANLQPENELIPAHGVYLSHVKARGRSYLALTNVGVRPTVEHCSPQKPVVETHLLGFQGELYGEALTLDFCARLRAERRFENLEQLQRQVARDIQIARRHGPVLERFWKG